MTNSPDNPIISIIMPSYNHEQFIGDAVASILSQTFQEFELLIVDDGSADGSAKVVAGFKDPRIRSTMLGENRGACEAMNIGLHMSRGKYIAVCNSDDVWRPEKLSTQLEFLGKNDGIGAVFSGVDWIGDDGAPLSTLRLAFSGNVFKQQNRSRWSWVRDLIETGNCLCHPSILIRRELYDQAGDYDNRLRQIPDLDMWLRVLQRTDIFVLPDALVGFRIHGGNVSKPNPQTSRRAINEHRLIVRRLFSEISKENFVRAFGQQAPSIDDDVDLKIEKALYLLSHRGVYEGIFKELGLDYMFDLLTKSEGRLRLKEKYGSDTATFHREMGGYSPWIVSADAVPDTSAGKLLASVPAKELLRVFLQRVKHRVLGFNRR